MLPVNLLPPGITYFIAGGFAACPALASDIDVWVIEKDPEFARENLLRHLRAVGFAHEPQEDNRRVIESYFLDTGLASVMKVAKVYEPGMLPIHILVTNGSPDDVIASFDISTHQVAITSEGRVKCGQMWTPPHVRPIKLRDTPTTDERMVKIGERFGHIMEHAMNTTGVA